MQVSIAEGKAQFAELVRRAAAGERIVITRHGRVVAALVGAGALPAVPLLGALRGQIVVTEDGDGSRDDALAQTGGAAGEGDR